MTLTRMWVPICLYCSNCTQFGQLIFRKIVKIVAIRCQILWLKCTKFDFGLGSAPDPAGGAYSAPPDPLAAFGGPTSKGRGEGRGRKGWGEGRGSGEGREWEELKPPLSKFSGYVAAQPCEPQRIAHALSPSLQAINIVWVIKFWYWRNSVKSKCSILC